MSQKTNSIINLDVYSFLYIFIIHLCLLGHLVYVKEHPATASLRLLNVEFLVKNIINSSRVK